MAKGKGKRSSGVTGTAADARAPSAKPQITPDMSQLDESAFAGLRQTIEQRLKNQSSSKGKSKKDNKPQASIEITPTKMGQSTALRTGKKQDSTQGKKRDRNGDVIAREGKKGGKNKQTKPEDSKDEEEIATLRQEILALGGTEEDLELLAGVDSESEVEGVSSKGNKGGDNDLRKELSKMLEAAGHVVPDDLEDEEAEEEMEDDLEANEESDEDEEENTGSEDVIDISDIDDTPPAKESKAKATKSKEPEVVVPKEYSKLVSSVINTKRKSMLADLSDHRQFFPDLTGTTFPYLRSTAQSR